MLSQSLRSFAGAALYAALSGTGAAMGHDVNHQGRPPIAADPSRVPIVIVDRPVIDQDGVPHALTELIGRHVVVVNFIYTSCGTLCPLQSAVLADLQDQLGSRLSRDVELLSISVDPVVDQVPRLHEQSVQFGARPGWAFLTGKPKDVEVILTGMQAWVETPEDHPGFFLVGAADQKHWYKLDGLPSPEALLDKIDAIARLRNSTP